MRAGISTITVALAATIMTGVIAEEPGTLDVADYLNYERAADPQLSPDGRTIIYTRSWIDQQADNWDADLWIMNADGTNHRFLVDGSNARWSPDGSRILYLAPDKHKKPQIHVRWMEDGATSQVTRIQTRPISPTWSPDGSQIAYISIIPSKTPWNIELPSPPEGATWSKPPRILDRLHYRQDYVGFTEPGHTHLFVVPANSGSPRQLTSGETNVGPRFFGLFFGASLSWTPDSQSIVFDGLVDSNLDKSFQESNIYRVDVTTKEVTQLTQDEGSWTFPVVSPDGERIAYTGFPKSDKTYTMPRLYVMDIDGGNASMTGGDFDRPVQQLRWDERNRGVYFAAEDQGYVNVFFANLGGKVQPVTRGNHTVSISSLARNTGVGVYSSFYQPVEVATFRLSTDQTPELITGINDDLLQGIDLGEQKDLHFTATDGNEAHGWVITPPGFDENETYPLIMEIHGGPFAMYAGNFRFDFQLFAAAGFTVIYTNPRGSTGYGEAFSQAIDHAYPSVDYDDLIAAVDAIVAQGNIDTKRMYVGGCSGGGVLSSWVIAHTDRFAAAAVRCPVSNWLSLAGTSDIPKFTYAFFQKPFWEDPTDWLHHSSLMHVGKVNTPTIVMTGEQDLRTPMSQSEEYYAALKIRDVPSKLIRFNDQYHGTGTRPSNFMRTVLYMMSWYNRYTIDGAVEAVDIE